MSEVLTKEHSSEFFETVERRSKKKNKKQGTANNNLTIKRFAPLTDTQARIYESFQNSDQNIFLHGFAGTGKSFISLYNMMKILLETDQYKKLVIVRSAIPSRLQGFLPGTAAEKAKVYELAYQNIFTELFDRSDAYTYLKNMKKVEFETTSYLRGTTYNDSLIFFDEAQNTLLNESKTVLTRVGQNSRIVISGDFTQSDIYKDEEKRDILYVMKILKKMKSVDFFEFKKEDIVRSGFVKQFLLAEDEVKRNVY